MTSRSTYLPLILWAAVASLSAARGRTAAPALAAFKGVWGTVRRQGASGADDDDADASSSSSSAAAADAELAAATVAALTDAVVRTTRDIIGAEVAAMRHACPLLKCRTLCCLDIC